MATRRRWVNGKSCCLPNGRTESLRRQGSRAGESTMGFPLTGMPTSDSPPHQPTVELSWRAVILGLIIGLVMTAANTYLGLYAGMTVSASIPAAIVSMGVLRGLLRRGTILENNIVQTMSSAGRIRRGGHHLHGPGSCDRSGVDGLPLLGGHDDRPTRRRPGRLIHDPASKNVDRRG